MRAVNIADPDAPVHIWTSRGLLPESSLTRSVVWKFHPSPDHIESITCEYTWTLNETGETVAQGADVYGSARLPAVGAEQATI